ncbi:MAG TPA: DUF4381 family protein [Vicinamibacteria bacterium]
MLPLALLLLAQAAGGVSVTAVPSKTEVTVGETFAVDLKATGPAGTTFTFPGEAATDTFDLRTPPAGPQGAAPAEPGTHRYEAAVFALGEATLPPIPVRYRLPDGTEGEASTQAVALKVVSLLPKSAEDQKLADIRGPQPVAIGAPFWIALGLALVLAAALAWWLFRRRRKAETPSARALPDAPADVEALRALDALAASGLASRGDYRGFYIRLTEVAKRYLERRLGAPVLEMTTAETIAFLRGHAHGGGLVPVMRDLAEAADRIKFARGQGLAQEAERHLAAVRALVPALEARLRPVEAEPKAEGKAA